MAIVMLQKSSSNHAAKDLIRLFRIPSTEFWSWFYKLILFDTLISDDKISSLDFPSAKKQGPYSTSSEKPSGEDNGVGPAGSGGGEAGKARQRAVMSFSLTPSRGGEVRSETFDY